MNREAYLANMPELTLQRLQALLACGREELLDGQPRLRDQTAQRAPCNFRMIGYREGGDVAWPSHNDMAALLPDHLPAKALKDLDDI